MKKMKDHTPCIAVANIIATATATALHISFLRSENPNYPCKNSVLANCIWHLCYFQEKELYQT